MPEDPLLATTPDPPWPPQNLHPHPIRLSAPPPPDNHTPPPPPPPALRSTLITPNIHPTTPIALLPRHSLSTATPTTLANTSRSSSPPSSNPHCPPYLPHTITCIPPHISPRIRVRPCSCLASNVCALTLCLCMTTASLNRSPSSSSVTSRPLHHADTPGESPRGSQCAPRIPYSTLSRAPFGPHSYHGLTEYRPLRKKSSPVSLCDVHSTPYPKHSDATEKTMKRPDGVRCMCASAKSTAIDPHPA